MNLLNSQLSRLAKKAARPLAGVVTALLFLCLMPGLVHAQTFQYTNTTDSAVGGITGTNACSVSAAFQRDFVVTDDFVVDDVDFGLLFAHDNRGDVASFLQSPAGNFVRVMTRTGGGADNFNVFLDDQAATSVDGHFANDTATAATTVPPYQRTFIPNQGLNAGFAGQSSFGTWTLFICDFANNGIDGQFFQADLFLTPATGVADLSLNKAVASGSPSSAVYTLSVTNSSGSDLTASGVQVLDILPAGVTFTGASGTGTYNSGTGIWDIGLSIAPGDTVSIDLNVDITAGSGTTIVNNAEIITSSAPDPDSTPNNAATGEDDFDSISFTVGGRFPGIPPNINGICAAAGAGITTLDWNNLAAGESWASGSPAESFTVGNLGLVGFAVATEGTFNAPLALTLDNNGGLGSAGLSLFQSIEYININQVTTTTVTLPTAVPGVQFTIFDVDFAINDFADRLQITGSFNGGPPVNATLTNGQVNFILGNEAIGDGGADGTSDDGNVIVTFSTPVDTITIVYGNHTTAPADPDGQAISIHDFNFCTPQATLSVTKMSQVISDPVNGSSDPKAIPGAIVQYCILISNAGSADAALINATDTIPGNVTYIADSMRSGSNCGSAVTVEDDDATGADESDPFGSSISGTDLTALAASLGPSEGYALVFQVIVD